MRRNRPFGGTLVLVLIPAAFLACWSQTRARETAFASEEGLSRYGNADSAIESEFSGQKKREQVGKHSPDEYATRSLVQEIVPQPPTPLPSKPKEPEPAKPSQPPAEPSPALAAETERPDSEKPLDQLLLEAGGVLLPQGVLQLDPNVEYAHTSGERVAISGFTILDAIVIGTIRVDDLSRDIVTAALTTRYGLTNRFQLDLRLPGVWRHDTEVLGVGTMDQTERSIDGVGLGDIEAGISWQALYRRGAIPDSILRISGTFPTGRHPFEIERERVGPGQDLRLKDAPTGNGFYGAKIGTTLVWQADPAVFFAGGGYTFNFSRQFGEFGEVVPGDSGEFFGGLNVALSEKVSLNLSFIDRITQQTKQNDVKVAGSALNDGRLLLGASIGLNPSTTLIVTASAGLTEDSPDFALSVGFPTNFSVEKFWDRLWD